MSNYKIGDYFKTKSLEPHGSTYVWDCTNTTHQQECKYISPPHIIAPSLGSLTENHCSSSKYPHSPSLHENKDQIFLNIYFTMFDFPQKCVNMYNYNHHDMYRIAKVHGNDDVIKPQIRDSRVLSLLSQWARVITELQKNWLSNAVQSVCKQNKI